MDTVLVVEQVVHTVQVPDAAAVAVVLQEVVHTVQAPDAAAVAVVLQEVVQVVQAPAAVAVAVVLQESVQVLTVGLQGPAGPSGSVSLYEAGVALSGHAIATVDAVGLAILADVNNAAHANAVIGMTMNAAAQGASVAVNDGGLIEFLGWSWTPGQCVFLGPTPGSLSQARGTGLYSKVIGMAVAPNRIVIELQPALFFN